MSPSSLSEYPDFQFSTTLVFSRDDPCNCTITLDQKPIYEVKSRRQIVNKLGHNDLIFLTDVFAPMGEPVAAITWRGSRSDSITWPKRELKNAKSSAWLKRSFVPFSNTVTFKDSEGRSYKWDTDGPRNQFRLLEGKCTVIAYFERANPYVNLQPGYSYNPAPKPSCLHLSDRANAILEEVVLSFLIAERYRRRRDVSVENWADAQASAASYMGSMALIQIAKCPWFSVFGCFMGFFQVLFCNSRLLYCAQRTEMLTVRAHHKIG